VLHLAAQCAAVLSLHTHIVVWMIANMSLWVRCHGGVVARCGVVYMVNKLAARRLFVSGL
jgi:hypothetical protein